MNLIKIQPLLLMDGQSVSDTFAPCQPHPFTGPEDDLSGGGGIGHYSFLVIIVEVVVEGVHERWGLFKGGSVLGG